MIPVRVWFLAIVIAPTLHSRVQAQAYANSAECNSNCGGTSGVAAGRSGSGNTQPSNAAAAKYAAIQNKLRLQQEIINSIGDGLLGAINSAHKKSSATDDSDPDADDSSDSVIQDSGSENPPQAPSDASDDADASPSSNQPSASTASAIDALLGGNAGSDSAPTADNGVANEIGELLDSSKVSDSASVFASSGMNSPSLPTIADPEFNKVLQESNDQHDPHDTGSFSQMLQSRGQQIKDPETVADLAQAQATVGFVDILKGMAGGPRGVAKGVYSYGSKMVNQMGAYLGFADANFFGGDSQNQAH